MLVTSNPTISLLQQAILNTQSEEAAEKWEGPDILVTAEDARYILETMMPKPNRVKHKVHTQSYRTPWSLPIKYKFNGQHSKFSSLHSNSFHIYIKMYTLCILDFNFEIVSTCMSYIGFTFIRFNSHLGQENSY